MNSRADGPGPPGGRSDGAHVGLDTLADHQERLLDPDTAARVDSHLRDCVRCAALVEDLRGVSMLLASQPSPSMPDAVRLRIEEVLHTEQASQPSPADHTGTDQVGGRSLQDAGTARQRRTRLSRALLAAAAAVAVVAVGGVVLDEVGTGGSVPGSAGQGGQMTTAEEPQSRPDAPRAGASSLQPPGVAPRSQGQPSLIEEIYRTRTVTIQRERAACVGAAVGDPQWVGTSYSVQLAGAGQLEDKSEGQLADQSEGRRGVVAFLGDADNTAPKTTGVLIVCDPEPTVVRRQQLRR